MALWTNVTRMVRSSDLTVRLFDTSGPFRKVAQGLAGGLPS